MKPKLLLMAVLCTAIFSSYAAEDVVLIHGPEVDLTLQDVERALASMTPEARRPILMDQRRIRNVMDSTYMAKVAAERARKHGLEKDPVVQAKIWNRTLNILASAELDRAVEEQLGSNADYESMARERYLLDKEKFREPEKVKGRRRPVAAAWAPSREGAWSSPSRMRPFPCRKGRSASR